MKITESRLRRIIKNIILENTSNLSINSIEEARKVFMESDNSYVYEGSSPIMHIREVPGYISEIRAQYDRNGVIEYWNIVYKINSPSRSDGTFDEKIGQILNKEGMYHTYLVNPRTGKVAPMRKGAER